MARKKICGIYKIENLVNGKVYIGQSVDIYTRWISHKNASLREGNRGYNYPLYRAFRKYGIDNFYFEIIEECTEEELDEKEIYYINKYKSFVGLDYSNGYNQTLGGEGSRGKTCPFGKDNPNSSFIFTKDEIYYSLNDFKRKTGISTSTVYGWLNGRCVMSKEWDDKGLRYLDGHTDNIIIHQDEEYEEQVRKNKEEAYRKLKEKELTPSNAFKVYCEGVEFPSVNKCAEHYGVNPGTMKEWTSGNISMPKEWYDKGLRREDKKMSDYKIRVEKSKKVVCDGVVFNSIKDCSKHYKISANSIKGYLSKKYPMPKKFYDMELHFYGDDFNEMGYEVKTEYSKNSKAVVCDGIEYPNIKYCSEHYNINENTMKNWLNHSNKMPKMFYDLGLHYKDEPMENYRVSKKCRLVTCEGIIFGSINECALHYNIKPCTMEKWLSGKNPMPQEFKDKGLKYYK